MTIVSHPGPDRSITIEGLHEYKVFNRRYRNRRIGDFLKELYLTEGRNTGFQKILKALEKNGSPKPLFDTNESRDYFTTTLYIHPEFLYEGINEGKKNRASVIERLLMENPTLTTANMVEITGYSKSTVERTIKTMKEAGILVREDDRKTGKWVVLRTYENPPLQT